MFFDWKTKLASEDRSGRIPSWPGAFHYAFVYQCCEGEAADFVEGYADWRDFDDGGMAVYYVCLINSINIIEF